MSNQISSIIVVGSGIGGLSFTAIARKIGIKKITVIERAQDVCKAKNMGSGIGLWPNSTRSLDLLGLTPKLVEVSSVMQSPSYRNPKGNMLAEGSMTFTDKFPVYCLNRDALQSILYENCSMLSHSNASECEVEFISNVTMNHYEDSDRGIYAHLSNGAKIYGDILIGADGINSTIRKQLLQNILDTNKSKLEPVVSCGYSYFRATVDLSNVNNMETFGISNVLQSLPSFETWGFGVRFGFVPLNGSKVFWFCAISDEILLKSTLRPLQGVHTCDDSSKDFLMSLLKGWRGPPNSAISTDITSLINCTPASHILRTDINKVLEVEKFPWQGHDGKVILLGDSAHATAPNLAQGAGLCIEDAFQLARQIQSFNNRDSDPANILKLTNAYDNEPHLAVKKSWAGYAKEYELLRKPRAVTVQKMADAIAYIGQLSSYPAISLRNAFMRTANFFLPSLQRRIFEKAVSHSLGGNFRQLSWLPPVLDIPSDPEASAKSRDMNSLLGRVFNSEQFNKLSQHVRDFRTSERGGEGYGTVTVAIAKGLRRLNRFCKFIGLPAEMQDAPFRAVVEVKEQGLSQLWSRTFNFGQPTAVTYSTTHSTYVRSSEVFLVESVGGILDKLFAFVYDVKIIDSNPGEQGVRISYKSTGMVVNGLPLILLLPSPVIVFFLKINIPRDIAFRVPLPSWLLPRNQWIEESTNTGWKFSGRIQLPGGWTIMKYDGDFNIAEHKADETIKLGNGNVHMVQKDKVQLRSKAIVAGGTGLLGSAVCDELLQRGWEVTVLTRDSTKIHVSTAETSIGSNKKPNRKAKMVLWDGKTGNSWCDEITADTVIINLSGENPGARRWNTETKSKILTSRLDSIAAISDALAKIGPERHPRAFLQASAAGVYGNVGDEHLHDWRSSTPSSPETDDTSFNGDGDNGDTFRVSCCREIEDSAVGVVKGRNIRLSLLRIGHVLTMDGGLLPHLDRASFFGASRLGTGHQYIPWVHIDDLSRMVEAIASCNASSPLFEGPINLTSPYPVINAHFLSELAVARKRWHAMIPVSAMLIKPVVGESSSVILDSQRMVPTKLIKSGFEFSYPDLPLALKTIFNQ